ncbi:MAG: hypothetical protein LBT47_04385 [Deltaproteobacteria bacterium]|jgi:hypothetical protein|nr:hypothetical protein [Deltaproteobacteria bacterium]
MNKSIPADPIMLAGMTDCLAIAVENAVLEWGETLDSFFDKFIASGLADSFSNQEPFVTTGCTGEELVAKVNELVSGAPQNVRISQSSTTSYSEFYWVGYALALYIAERGDFVQQIIALIPPSEWLRLYPTHHEYGDDLLVEKLAKIVQKKR